jgi:hypothetical protein
MLLSLLLTIRDCYKINGPHAQPSHKKVFTDRKIGAIVRYDENIRRSYSCVSSYIPPLADTDFAELITLRIKKLRHNIVNTSYLWKVPVTPCIIDRCRIVTT